ncbi:MAG: hypothetical protein ACOH19_16805 [Rhodoglobus sp.]
MSAYLFAAMLVAVTPAMAMAAVVGCSAADKKLGNCPSVSGSVGDSDVTLVGSGNSGGSGNSSNSAGGNGGGGNGAGNTNGGGGGPPPCVFPCREPFTVTSITERPVTLSDVAHFRPNPGVNLMQPDGWMVVGLDTNFYSTGGVQVHDGTLLGYPASVKFTPVRWRWTYGDGAAATRATPGSTWAGGGFAEFDRTPTSHIYQNPGTYFIDLTITYAVEYRFAGQAWTDIPGTLTLPSNRLRVSGSGAKTVLVEDDCTINPSGPGC